jgi:outer membrane protein assembly factor BamD (BamD/ComL family)
VHTPDDNLRAALRGVLKPFACLAAAGVVAAWAPFALAASRPAVAPAGSEGTLRLERAQAAWRLAQPLAVVRELEPVDFASGPSFEGADRAAFLLAQAWLELGSRGRFEQLARQVATWPHPTSLTLALADENALLAHGPGGADALRPGSAPRLLADAEGAERFRAAARRIANHEDPLDELGRVPSSSALAPAASDLAARVAYERGDHEGAARDLRRLLERDTTYAARREIAALLADDALGRGEPREAWERFNALDGDWQRAREELRALAARPRLDSLVTAWEDDPARSGAALVPTRRLAAGAQALGRAGADLHAPTDPVASAFDRPERAAIRGDLLTPEPAEWKALEISGVAAGEAASDAARAGDDVRRERDRLAMLRAYLEGGRDSLGTERVAIEARLARLGELHRTLEAIDARLRAVRDSASHRAVERAAALVAQCEANERWIAGMRHFWVDGPSPLRAPAGQAGPDSVLATERDLVRRVAAIAALVGAQAPVTIANSYARAWRPGVLDRIARQDAEAGWSLTWAKSLAATLDSSLAATARATRLHAFEARAAALDRRADSLATAGTRQRDAVARRAVRRTLAAMEGEREGIDYGLAAAAWAMAAALDDDGDAARPDSVEAPENPEATRWRTEAVARLQAFLSRHPSAAARADARFRLADMLEQQARQDFRGRMQAYLRQPVGGVPVLETGPAIALHRAILRDDPSFAHRDAVLYDLGSLLAEHGDPAATTWFRELVNAYPGSDYAQESWLRLADEAFDQQRFADAAPLYQAAVEGRDTTMRVIALYKLGWTQFHIDRFEPAADAFGAVIDLYTQGHVDPRIRLDDDAEVLLVQTLARAGGADAFAAWFDRVGPRPYEVRLLGALGQHFRKYALFGPAIAADQLMIDRHPLAPEALEAARRMDDTWLRWNRPAERDEALLANADRFVHDGAWAAAQPTDSLRAAGDAFARAAILEVAGQRHRAARSGGGDEAWRDAARLEERVLAAWPQDAEHRRVELQACEARAALGDVEAALAHADAVAQERDTLAAAAALQRVAILDAWYERTRPASPGATGRDSVANAVLAAGDALLEAFPADAHAADVRWRQGQLAFAHGWLDRAADAFGALADRTPGDPRAPRAATLRADVYVRQENFARAQDAYERALAVARGAGDDSLARRVERAIPACAYRDAEARVAADSSDALGAATRFENVALRWPSFEHADLALYRAGLAYFRAGRTSDGARAMAALLTTHPRSEFVRDAGRATAGAWEASGDTASAGQAWLDFAARHRGDAQADDASLRAAELFERSHAGARADSLRLAWIRRHPADFTTAMALLEPVVSRSLDSVSTSRPVSRWLAVPGARKGTAPRSTVADYLARAKAHPDLASRAILARVAFLEGEEASAACAKVVLRQPLAKPIGLRKQRLDLLLARYRGCVELGVAEWAHAASFRIGEALVAFGDALEASQRPADLHGEDRRAYDEVIHRQSDVFYARAENVWAEVLNGQPADQDDLWLARARTALEPRAALRAQASQASTADPNAVVERKQTP